jgi:YccS/YhfK family integral membrane protein
MDRYLRLYFVAQDVHERASSSHYPYGTLVEAFFHSDVMFRCQRLLALQGRTCERLARAIQLRQPLAQEPQSEQARADLQASLDFLRGQDRPQWRELLASLGALARNLATLDAQLAGVGQPGLSPEHTDSSLLDRSPGTLRNALARVRSQLTPSSPVFRHAVRLSAALLAGYALLHLVQLQEGYWVMLTTVFVCQPSFGATRQRVVQRVLGTFAGLVAGWAVLGLVPSLMVQAALAVVAGVVFFTTRTSRYLLATGAMTLLVLLCFNQAGDSHTLFVPRIVDTLIGSAIAVAAVFLVLPDWQGRRMHLLASQAIANHSRYLREIVQQYRSGKRDDLPYRLARRNAHNADAALSTALSNMLKEPGFVRREGGSGLHFLVLTHTLLSHLSALGAHRQQLEDDPSNAAILQAADHIAQVLDGVAASLQRREAPVADADTLAAEVRLVEEMERLTQVRDGAHALVLGQLALVCRQLGALRQQAGGLLRLVPGAAVPA